ncbi:hypothetical protein H9P43_005054 [Blastocladiella emersonii ATCC 22665]|nr:hypothetical protein H9P43_005054 [Blastocladiella emersonii ATCC 22665]
MTDAAPPRIMRRPAPGSASAAQPPPRNPAALQQSWRQEKPAAAPAGAPGAQPIKRNTNNKKPTGAAAGKKPTSASAAAATGAAMKPAAANGGGADGETAEETPAAAGDEHDREGRAKNRARTEKKIKDRNDVQRVVLDNLIEAVATVPLADPSTWPDLYPLDTPFRKYYFADQRIPIPDNRVLQFSADAAHGLWDRALPFPTGPVSLYERLTDELTSFSEFLGGTRGERFLRKLTFDRLEATLRPLLGEGTLIMLFGSSASPAYNPASDLDVGILPANASFDKLSDGKNRSTKILSKLLKPIGVLGDKSIEWIPHAKVPLIKYTDVVTKMEVDLSVQWEGFTSVQIVEDLVARYPSTVPLVRTVKAMLNLHGINKGAEHGINGFCALCMVIAILQRMEAMGIATSVDPENPAPLDHHITGMAFLTFVHFFGFVFDPATTGIDNTNNGVLFLRDNVVDRLYQNNSGTLLVTSVRVQTPAENVGRSVDPGPWLTFRTACQRTFLTLYQLSEGPETSSAAAALAGEHPVERALLAHVVALPDAYTAAMAATAKYLGELDKYAVGAASELEWETQVRTNLLSSLANFLRKHEEAVKKAKKAKQDARKRQQALQQQQAQRMGIPPHQQQQQRMYAGAGADWSADGGSAAAAAGRARARGGRA